MTIGFDRGTSGPRIVKFSSSFAGGEAAMDGPLGRERWRAGLDRNALVWRMLLGWCIIIVSMERRETRLGRESTRWKSSGRSSTLDLPLSVTESSQSESSSSSIALSETSSSVSMASSSRWLGLLGRKATSSLNEATFFWELGLLVVGRSNPPVAFSCVGLATMRSSKELSSSSPEDPPNVNIPPFFLRGEGFNCVVERDGLPSIANRGCDRKDEEIIDGEKPRTMLGDLINSGREGRTPDEETLVSEFI